MLTVTESRYDVVTSADLSPRAWSAFLEDARRLVNYFEFSVKFRVRLPLSSACDLVWQLDGLPETVRVKGNCLAALCLSFHCAEQSSGDTIESILSGSDDGELLIEAGELHWIGEHFTELNTAFGTTEPDANSSESLECLENYLAEQFAKEVWGYYGQQLYAIAPGTPLPLFHAAIDAELREAVERATERYVPEIMALFLA